MHQNCEVTRRCGAEGVECAKEATTEVVQACQREGSHVLRKTLRVKVNGNRHAGGVNKARKQCVEADTRMTTRLEDCQNCQEQKTFICSSVEQQFRGKNKFKIKSATRCPAKRMSGGQSTTAGEALSCSPLEKVNS